MTKRFTYHELPNADLRVDALYSGQLVPNKSQKYYRDPFGPLLGVKAQGGFRWRGEIATSPFMVVYSDFVQLEWPDRIDEITGQVFYFGDNRHPGYGLHDVAGNRWLRDTFCAAESGARDTVAPTFIFTKGGEGRAARFRGLAVPNELVAVWRSSGQERFQNYRASFTILDELTISRAWISALIGGESSANELAPETWTGWVRTGRARSLTAEPVTRVRSKGAQLPDGAKHMDGLKGIHGHFPKESAYEFEKLAKWLVERMDRNVGNIDLTRPWRDGGRDGLGQYRIGPPQSAVNVEFALEAKCYAPGKTGVGVKDTSRLISRLRHRQFGVLVTTSYVHNQAYKEIMEDGHPVVIIAGVDLIELLPAHLRDPKAVKSWLEIEFPV